MSFFHIGGEIFLLPAEMFFACKLLEQRAVDSRNRSPIELAHDLFFAPMKRCEDNSKLQ